MYMHMFHVHLTCFMAVPPSLRVVSHRMRNHMPEERIEEASRLLALAARQKLSDAT